MGTKWNFRNGEEISLFHLYFSAMSLDKFEKSPREIFHPEIQKVGRDFFVRFFFFIIFWKYK